MRPLLLLAALTLVACDGGTGPDNSCVTSADCPTGQSCVDGLCRATPGRDGGGFDAGTGLPDTGPPGPTVIGLEIDPENPVLVSVDGMAVMQPFTVQAVQDDARRVPVTGTATWSLGHARLGELSPAGLFTGDGAAGGVVDVVVTLEGTTLRAMTTLTVRLERTIFAVGAPADAAASFAAAPVDDEARRANIRYPLEGAMMPHNVAPPDVQWGRGAAGDLYRVRVEKPNAIVTAYVAHTGAAFRYDWLAPRPAWSAILASDIDEPAVITVDRFEAATAEVVAGTPVTVRIARGGVYGVVYYWDANDGRIQRIAADTAELQHFMPSPPPNPRTGRRCVACHTVSRDGRYLAGILWSDDADAMGIFDLTLDLTVNPAPTVHPPAEAIRYVFGAFNPESTRLLTAHATGSFGMIDVTTGRVISATGLPSGDATHPEWSPDGSAVAYISNTDATTAAHVYRRGDLMLLPQTGPDAFGTPTRLHSGPSLASAAEGGNADTHPSWSPDSQLIAFAHCTDSQSGRAGVREPGALYLVGRDGGEAVRLDEAVGGAAAEDSYWPTFSPFVTAETDGTTFWLAFFSTRDYGNAQAGTRGTGLRQLWVTAISATGGPDDPSNVPYWLPGQDTTTHNIAAFWGPSPCRPNAAGCADSAECCSGVCAPDPVSGSLCAPPPSSECRSEGGACGGDEDCCDGLVCWANVCLPPVF